MADAQQAPAEPLADHPAPRTVAEAEANLAAVLPVAEVQRWSQMADGRWVDHSTGLVEDQAPPGHNG